MGKNGGYLEQRKRPMATHEMVTKPKTNKTPTLPGTATEASGHSQHLMETV